MKNRHSEYILSIVLVVLAACLGSMGANAATVKVKLDSTTMLMGNTTLMHVTVDERKGLKGHFPIFNRLGENGIVGVCGDSVELRAPVKVDTVLEGNSRKIKLDIPVQSFDSGYYRLPALEYVAGVDTFRSNSVVLKVYPVIAEANDPISDYSNVSDPEDPSFFDFIPQWMLDWWWLFLILILAIAAFVYGIIRYRRTGSLLPKKPEPTPYEKASAALRELKSEKLWEQGMEKEYFTRLTDILRTYLDGRFSINAMEMTSRQIMASLKKNPETKDKRAYFRQILDMADFVKFAKVRPLPDDNIAAYDSAVRFVEETKPVEPDPEENPDPKVDKKKKKGKSKKTRKGGEK